MSWNPEFPLESAMIALANGNSGLKPHASEAKSAERLL
jgi:hypothetical protein